MNSNLISSQGTAHQSETLSDSDAISLRKQLEDKNSTIKLLQSQMANIELEAVHNLTLAKEKGLIERGEQQCEIQNLQLEIAQLKKGIAQPSTTRAESPVSNDKVTPMAENDAGKLLDSTLSTLLTLDARQQQQTNLIVSLQSQFEEQKNTSILLKQTMHQMEEEMQGLQQELSNYQILELQRYQRLEQQQAQYHQLNQHNITRLDEALEQIHQSKSDTAQLITRQFADAIKSWDSVQTLLALNGDEFIGFLFQFALGRKPLDYEIAHFSNLLELGTDKYAIVQQFFSSEEHKVWINSRQLIENDDKSSTIEPQQNQLAMNSDKTTDEKGKVGIIEAMLFSKKIE